MVRARQDAILLRRKRQVVNGQAGPLKDLSSRFTALHAEAVASHAESWRLTMQRKAFGVVVFLLLVTAGCTRSGSGGNEHALRIAMVPTTDPGKIVRESQPLVKY